MSADAGGAEPLDLLVAAGVVVRRGDEILLQRRGDDHTWGLPGGALVPGETLEQAARRELTEETGLVAGDLRLLDVYSGPEFQVGYPDGYRAYVVGATFEAVVVSGTLSLDEAGESLALEWFARDALPQDVNAFNRAVLGRVGLAPGRS